MNCNWNAEELSALLDGELTSQRSHEVTAHLTGCAECRQTLAQLQAAQGAFRSVSPTSAPSDLARRVLAAVPSPVRRNRSGRRWAVGTALAAVLALAVWGVFEPPTGPEFVWPGDGSSEGRIAVTRFLVRTATPMLSDRVQLDPATTPALLISIPCFEPSPIVPGQL